MLFGGIGASMKKKKNNIGKTVLSIVLLVLILAGAGYFVYVYFQIEEIKVVGNERFEAQTIEQLAAIEPKTHMLMLDEEKVKKTIEEKEPYIEVLSIKKSIPKTVIIEVKERKPKALVAYADQFLLVDEDANVLEILPATTPAEYPIISGITVQSINLGMPVETEDAFKLSVLSEMVKELEKRELFTHIATIDLLDINNITLKSTSGLLIKFGQADKVADKVKWIKNRLPAYEKDNISTGVLDVSAGSFATYKLDGPEQPAEGEAAPTDQEGEEQSPQETQEDNKKQESEG